ncbi:hypothetical protein [Burkholderia aenigmatica]|nr:hypothetical protein [Burkholderia aenigmatica]MDN7875124.1 hypothetical protein [Burkholderia aenigmatica]
MSSNAGRDSARQGRSRKPAATIGALAATHRPIDRASGVIDGLPINCVSS